jgi:hypothetical protein
LGAGTLLGIHIHIPNDQSEFYLWLICLLAGYLAIMFFVQLVFFGRSFSGIDMVGRIFDGLTFAISVLLLMGVVYHSVLLLIGDTTPFLVVAGAVGVLYGIVRIFL